MKKIFRIIALCLIFALLLTGCSMEDIGGNFKQILQNVYGFGHEESVDYTSFPEMEYVRPDMASFAVLTDDAMAAATTAADVEALMDAVNTFFDAYVWFYTYYNLADIHYCIDMTDPYWQEEYNYCMEQSSVVDAAREDLLYALADSKFRQELESESYFGADFFDVYEGESIYDETFLNLINQETEILNRYYQISAEAASVEFASEEYYTVYGTQLADILVELIAVRQDMAAYCGYESYPAFAYDFYHGRDFTPDQAESYMQLVSQELTDLYRQVNETYSWSFSDTFCTETETFAYVKKTAEAMGSDFDDGFAFLEEDNLFHISPGANKYNASFEVYLSGYDQPFIFMNPVQDDSDKLTFAHEFGHYMADYYTWGSNAGTDVLEVQSQTMEYLSLIYGEADQELVDYKMASSLCVYVEQSAYALFEQQMYDLKGVKLTAENLQALYEQIGTEFGFDSWAWDSRDFVTVPHFYSYPMYIISYVVSNDLALQIYQQELETPGAGLETYEQILGSDEWYIMALADDHGLKNPLILSRMLSVRQLFSDALAS